MIATLTLTLQLVARAQAGGTPPAQKPEHDFLKMFQEKNAFWLPAYSKAALAMLDDRERAALEKLKAAGVRVELRGPPPCPMVWEDGERFIEPPRGIDLVCSTPATKPGIKPPPLAALAALAELRHVEKLHFRRYGVNDEALEWLAGMKDLWYLDLATTRITDAGLKKLTHMKRLELLYLQAVRNVSDPGFTALAELPALKDLNLTGTHIGDVGVAALAKNVNLTDLHLGDTVVGDKGVAALANNIKLEILGLQGTAVGNAGVVALAGLPGLRILSVERTRVTDAGLAAIARPGWFLSLDAIHLDDTAVSDAGLQSLHDPKCLARLTFVTLDRTKVTEEGIAALLKARPKIRTIPRPKASLP
jgi:hypothetical protein